MEHLVLVLLLLGTIFVDGIAEDTGKVLKARGKAGENQEALGSGIDGERYKTACPDYKHYAAVPQYALRLDYLTSSRMLMFALVGP